MSVTAIPDLVGMLLMMGVLVWLRRMHSRERVDAWLLGLLFILIETVTSDLFRGTGFAHTSAHVAALDAYLAAGVTFGWAARQDMLPNHSQFPFFVLPAIPWFVLSTLYGLDLTRPALYISIALASLLLGVAFLLFRLQAPLRLRATLLAVHLAIWIPSLFMAFDRSPRLLVYWGLTCLYLLVAFSFRRQVRRGQIGGLVIVAGFVIWAACFFLHPVTSGHPVVDGLVEQIWTMQKFVVILGMLLTLLEGETERRKAEAMHDSLTGLPNRRLFDDRFAQALERSLRTGRSVALFLVDLDNFKEINDTYGHAAGDFALCSVADQLKRKVRSSDTLARCGGDEFCVIVNELTRREDCDRIAEVLREAITLSSPAEWGLGASVGYALFPDDAADAEQVLALADRRMYLQKSAGATAETSDLPPSSLGEFAGRRVR